MPATCGGRLSSHPQLPHSRQSYDRLSPAHGDHRASMPSQPGSGTTLHGKGFTGVLGLPRLVSLRQLHGDLPNPEKVIPEQSSLIKQGKLGFMGTYCPVS